MSLKGLCGALILIKDAQGKNLILIAKIINFTFFELVIKFEFQINSKLEQKSWRG